MKARVHFLAFLGLGILFFATCLSTPLKAATCGPGVNYAPTCAAGYYTLDTTLQMQVYTGEFINTTLSGTTVLYLQSVDQDRVNIQVVSMDLSGGGFTLKDTGSQGFFYDDIIINPDPVFNSELTIYPDEFISPLGVPDSGPFRFYLFSNIDRFPPLGTHWQIWPDDPGTSRRFSYRVYYTEFDYLTFEATISKDPNLTWLVFNEELSYSPTAPAVPVPAAVWLFGSGLIGLFGFMRRRKATY